VFERAVGHEPATPEVCRPQSNHHSAGILSWANVRRVPWSQSLAGCRRQRHRTKQHLIV